MNFSGSSGAVRNRATVSHSITALFGARCNWTKFAADCGNALFTSRATLTTSASDVIRHVTRNTSDASTPAARWDAFKSFTAFSANGSSSATGCGDDPAIPETKARPLGFTGLGNSSATSIDTFAPLRGNPATVITLIAGKV